MNTLEGYIVNVGDDESGAFGTSVAEGICVTLDAKLLQIRAMHDYSFSTLAVHAFGRSTQSRLLMCVHGALRAGLDFLPLAQELCDRYYVVCPDLPGHADSQFAGKPNDYNVTPFTSTAAVLSHFSHFDDISWIGTSMGGRAGIFLAARDNSPIKRLVLNDVPPVISLDVAKTFQKYIRWNPGFDSLREAAELLQKICHGFDVPIEEWERRARLTTKVQADGRRYFNHDMDMAEFVDIYESEDDAMWERWGKIDCPILLLRGEHSKMLSRDDVKRMERENPLVQVQEIPGIGHAPTLSTEYEIELVSRWLEQVS